jgi:hypothetical protein
MIGPVNAVATPPRRRWSAGAVAVALVVIGPATPAPAADPATLFEAKIRPLLVRACLDCHSGADAPHGLRLTDRAGWAESGVIEPGRPEASRLLALLRSADPDEVMPPPATGITLSAAEIAAVEEWISAGAVDPRDDGAAGSPSGPTLRRPPFALTAADRGHWAFQPLAVPETPAGTVASAAETIDRLVAADPAVADAAAVPLATARDLVRRATFDLHGLPPTPEAVAAFAADPSPAAWGRLIDALLAAHHHGERWGRFWLDWVRYAETNGYERDSDKPDAWRYRDYVIRAFARDTPYDEFLVAQIAGDDLAAEAGWSATVGPGRYREALIASGFLRLHQWDDEPANAAQADLDDADDILVSIGSAFLGLTIGCARCHDHKYDPLSQRDYSALVGFLRGLEPYGKPHRGGGSRGLGQIQRALGADGALALAAVELPTPAATFILHRGDVHAPGAAVEPGVPEILADRGDPLPPIVPRAGSSGRRLALARWLASPHHPLTARVLANRVWQRHFGTGIVATVDDFGITGAPPANRPLLDFLAAELIASGWSVHHLHRIIMGSRTYRTAAGQEVGAAPSYRRHRTARLDAEAIRDGFLFMAGHLGPKDAGPPVYPALPEAVRATTNQASFKWPESAPEEQDCRSVYLAVRRAQKPPFLEALDAPTGSAPTVVRPTTTTAPQALLLLNDPWVHAQAERLRDRVRRETGAAPPERLSRLWQIVYQREPSAAERAAAEVFLEEQAGGTDDDAAAWGSLCRALLNSNEAIHVD